MKRFLYPVLLVFVAVLAFNCQKELSGHIDPNPGGNVAAPIKATVQGRVLDENGQPASGVVIHAGGKMATTDAKGFFRIVKTSLDKNASVVMAEKTGYFKAYRTFQATSGGNNVTIKLIKKTLTGSINSTAGGNVTLANGSKIALPADAVVKAAGGSYSGTINVYAAYIDPTAADILQTIPGSFMADNKDGKRVSLYSYGMLAVELESASGEKLQIASGKTATLTSPIPSSALASAPSTIALWYVDEQTGIWKEEGTATKNGNIYVGEVKHFSFWNCDIGIPAVNLSMTLKNNSGIPLINVQVRLSRPGASWWTMSSGYTDSLGKVSGLVPANEIFLMEIINDCGTAIFSQNIGPFATNTDIGTIAVTGAFSSLVTIKGRILNCSNAPVTDGEVIVSLDGWPRYVSTSSTGDFSLVVTRCPGSSPACDITAIDNAGMQQATVNGIPITTPVTDAGDITACGTSSFQYVNYILDGVSYSITSAEAVDSIMGYTYLTGAGLYKTGIAARSASFTKNISFNFTSNDQLPGTWPIDFISVQDLNSSVILSPSTVTLTSFPITSGGYYEGSFSGSFRDPADLTVLHTTSGSFRIRRY